MRYYSLIPAVLHVALFPCPLGAPAVLLPRPVPQPQALV